MQRETGECFQTIERKTKAKIVKKQFLEKVGVEDDVTFNQHNFLKNLQ